MGTGSRPVFALGPIHDWHANGDQAHANWLAERWIILNEDGGPSVTSFAPSKDSPLDEMGMPDADSDEAIAQDLDGVLHKLELSGTYEASPNYISIFVAKMNLLCDGSQFYGDSYRLIQRNIGVVLTRHHWSYVYHNWTPGAEKGSLYPPAWGSDDYFGINIGVVAGSFKWEYTDEARDSIRWSLSLTEGRTA